MERFVWPIIAVLLMIFSAIKAEVQVTAHADGQSFYENQSIKILVTVSHGKSEKIDFNSFKLGQQKIEAKLIDQKLMTATGDLQLSLFHIEMPPQSKGPHLLPQVEVVVADKAYRSIPSTYEVSGAASNNTTTSNTSTSNQTPPQTSPTSVTPILKFEAIVDGPSTIYPGQKTLVGYRYTFNTSIDTVSEQTPLLEAQGLTKVGDKIVQQDQQGSNSIVQIYQIVKGDKTGDFVFGPSTLEGKPYQLSPSGEHVYTGSQLTSTTPAITIKVLPYPEQEKSMSFNGALGIFDWQVQLASPATVNVGDEISLTITATGQGDWDTVNLPELCCQPGMSGFFRFDDLPKVGEVKGNSKLFNVKLRPLTTSATEIPSIEFSSFDPDRSTYKTVHSKPIPIAIQGAVVPKEPPAALQTEEAPKSQWKENFNIPPPLQIGNSKDLTKSDLRDLFFGTWWTLFLIPFGIGFMMFQANCQIYLEKHQQEENGEKKSESYFKEALNENVRNPTFYTLLRKALLTRLMEHGEIASEDIDPHKLETSGKQGEVRSLLIDLEEDRYSGQSKLSENVVLARAKELFGKL